MNMSHLGSRAKPLIITRISHAVAKSAHRPTAVTINPARQLSNASATPTKPAQPPTSQSTTPSTSTTAATTSSTAGESATVPGAEGTSASSSSVVETTASSTSTWMWRTIYLTAAVGTAGLAAQYAYDPKPIQEKSKQVYDEIDARIRFFTEPSRKKLLPDQVPPPYASAQYPRTLILDLENTLVHSSYSRATGWRVAKRPGAEAFLAYLASFYEIVAFTSNMATYADPILYKLDPNGYVEHRLYRAETHFKDGVYFKDLSYLNRPLERVILIDKDEKCVQFNKDNAIIVPEWTGDPSDTTLLDLIPLLEGVVVEDVADVRDVLREVAGKKVQDAVTEYRAQAAARAESAKDSQTSMFGHVQEAEPVAAAVTPASTEKGDGSGDGDAGGSGADGANGSLWGVMPGRSALFHGKVDQQQK